MGVPKTDDDAGTMVYNELSAVIRRYMNEAPNMTAFQMVGALEAVKFDLMDTLVKHNTRQSNDE